MLHNLPENPIKNYTRGYACMLGEVIGRIVGESEDGSWGNINGVDMYSIPLFATPHGTVIKTGVLYLSEITPEAKEQLIAWEKELDEEGKEMYANKLT